MAEKSIKQLRDEAQEAVTELAEALATKHVSKWTPKQCRALTACTRAINRLAKAAQPLSAASAVKTIVRAGISTDVEPYDAVGGALTNTCPTTGEYGLTDVLR